MNKLFKLSLAILLIASGAQAENTGNGTVTLAVQEMLSDQGDNLSVEEKIYQRWQEAEGRRIPLKNYDGKYSGLSVMNRDKDPNGQKRPFYGLLRAQFKNHAAIQALDILLKAEMTTAVFVSSGNDFSDENLLQLFYVYSDQANDSTYVPKQMESGTMINGTIDGIRDYQYEYREIKPGVLAGVLFAITKDGIPGYCPWSGQEYTGKIIQPEVKNKKGKVIKSAVVKSTHTGWSNKRQDYKLPNVCDVTFLFHKN